MFLAKRHVLSGSVLFLHSQELDETTAVIEEDGQKSEQTTFHDLFVPIYLRHC